MAAGRARFGTKAGFILSGIGSAVGLGNIWRFPQVTSQEGGAAFVLVYIPLLIFIGVPLVLAELSLGQSGQGSPPNTIRNVTGGRFSWVGIVLIVASTIFLSYYTVIAGLALKYMIFSPTSEIFGAPSNFLIDSQQGPGALFMHLLFTALAVGIVVRGVSGGIEKANLFMMPALFVIVIVLAIYGLFLNGASEGVSFYLSPDFSQIDLSTIQLAIGQVFFSTSIGFGIMMTYGSYNDRGEGLLPSASTIAVSDMMVALTAGLMIFPIAFAQGVGGQITAEGAGLYDALFVTLPNAFAAISTGLFGKVLMIIFFAMITMAALSSAISGLEVIVSWLEERFNITRWKGAVLAAETTYGIGILAALSLDTATRFDAFVSNVLLIWGGILVCTIFAFGVDDRVDVLLGGAEDPTRRQVKMAKIIGFLIAYVIPIVLLAVWIASLDSTCVSILGQSACDTVGLGTEEVIPTG